MAVVPSKDKVESSTLSQRVNRATTMRNSEENSQEEPIATDASSTSSSETTPPTAVPWTAYLSAFLVWPCMLTLPLVMTLSMSPLHYSKVFPLAWYSTSSSGSPIQPLGLGLGILAVLIGQIAVWIFLSQYVQQLYVHTIQTKPRTPYSFWTQGVVRHVSQLEGFILLGAYLTGTWMLGLMPASYYTFDQSDGTHGTIQWPLVLASLVLQDAFQYAMHRLEHVPFLYKYTHKPHHKFTNPSWFDAFNGSVSDTVCMILIPLYLSTAVCLPTANVWTYMAFGSSYAAWLTMIHAEVVLPWDGIFRRLGLGTAGDHHVHHKFFKYNFGHTFMWWDQLCGTYRDPREFAPHVFDERA